MQNIEANGSEQVTMKQNPYRIAQWRFEQISVFLDSRLTPGERSRLVEEASRIPVLWLSGEEKPVSRTTLYRWIADYRRNPVIESLMPEPRQPRKGVEERAIQSEWVHYALSLLEQEPARSLYVLTRHLKLRFNLDGEISRSSLHRALTQERRYHYLRRLHTGKSKRLRTRFQALRPHEIWHGDAKGPFEVFLAGGITALFSVLSILDDATRYILAACIVLSESTASVISVFRRAAARWGLPDKWYADRGSPYDSHVFRKGLGILGVHRIRTRARNPEPHGKIEAYHRVLQRWFVTELKHQRVADERHLQALLEAVLETLYHEHRHRELRQSPREALGGRLSSRQVSLERLQDAFLIETQRTPHRKSGELRIGETLFRVPRQYYKRKVLIAVDPENPDVAFLKLDTGRLEPLHPAVQPASMKTTPSRTEPVGSLTPLLEQYRGRQLPLAYPGFGLPEIHQAFAEVLGRPVPATEYEARAISTWLGRCGPFEPRAFHHALTQVLKQLGPGRPLSQILIQLEQRVSTKRSFP